MKAVASIITILAASVAARPWKHNNVSATTSDTVLIVKEHQATKGDVWAIACTGELSFKLVQCGIDSKCTHNGTVEAEESWCYNWCQCAVEDILGPGTNHRFRSGNKGGHNLTVLNSRSTDPIGLASRSVERLSRGPKLRMNSTQLMVNSTLPDVKSPLPLANMLLPLANRTLSRVNTTLPRANSTIQLVNTTLSKMDSTLTQMNSTELSCAANVSDICSGVATYCELGLVHSSAAECVASCMCTVPGKVTTKHTGFNWGMQPNTTSPLCYGDVINVERCMENTACSTLVNGTLLVLHDHQECISMCSCT